MKQKVLIKVSMNGERSRSKAMKIAVSVSGVESAALKGDDKSQIEVTGEGVDAVSLATLLRKNVGYAELVSVGPVTEPKQEENKPKENEPPKVQVHPMVWSQPHHGSVPYYDHYYVVPNHNTDSCSIM